MVLHAARGVGLLLDFIPNHTAIDNRLAEEEILPLAQYRGIGVLVYLPFGRSRMWARIGDRELPEWAAEIDCTSWAQFFLKWVLGHPAVTCPIPATSRPPSAGIGKPSVWIFRCSTTSGSRI